VQAAEAAEAAGAAEQGLEQLPEPAAALVLRQPAQLVMVRQLRQLLLLMFPAVQVQRALPSEGVFPKRGLLQKVFQQFFSIV